MGGVRDATGGRRRWGWRLKTAVHQAPGDNASARSDQVACPPASLQRMPGCWIRKFDTSRQVDSTMPEPIDQW